MNQNLCSTCKLIYIIFNAPNPLFFFQLHPIFFFFLNLHALLSYMLSLKEKFSGAMPTYCNRLDVRAYRITYAAGNVNDDQKLFIRDLYVWLRACYCAFSYLMFLGRQRTFQHNLSVWNLEAIARHAFARNINQKWKFRSKQHKNSRNKIFYLTIAIFF